MISKRDSLKKRKKKHISQIERKNNIKGSKSVTISLSLVNTHRICCNKFLLKKISYIQGSPCYYSKLLIWVTKSLQCLYFLVNEIYARDMMTFSHLFFLVSGDYARMTFSQHFWRINNFCTSLINLFFKLTIKFVSPIKIHNDPYVQVPRKKKKDI